MLEICRGLQFSINRTKRASSCFHYPDIQSDSLARGPTEVYLQIFNEFVNQLLTNYWVLPTRRVQHVTLQMSENEKLKVF
jgi:hypothetical protein